MKLEKLDVFQDTKWVSKLSEKGMIILGKKRSNVCKIKKKIVPNKTCGF